MGRTQRAMCSGMLGLQSIVLFLTTPVLVVLTDVATGVAVSIGIGLTVACFLAAGLMRKPIGGAMGWGIQAASLGLGFVIGVMFVLGAIFLALYGGSWFLGRRIDEEKAAREAGAGP